MNIKRRSGGHPKTVHLWMMAGFGIFIPVIFVVLFMISGNRERVRYERQLVREYREIARLTANEGKDPFRADHPELAALQDYLSTRDPISGVVPVEKLVEATKTLRNRMQRKAAGQVNLSWTAQPSDMGGRTRALMFDPADSTGKRLIAGSVTGGLWVNDDITSPFERWRILSNDLQNLSISVLVADPRDSSVWYAGTGEPQTAVTIYRESSGLGTGILKSEDRGLTWQLLPSTEAFRYVSDIVARVEGDTTVLYAGVVSGVYHGTNHLSKPSDGLYRSADGGNTWQQVLPQIPGSKEVYAPSDLEISAGGRIFAGTMRNISGQGGAHILFSDDGLNWTVYDSLYHEISALQDTTGNIPGRTIIAASPSDSLRIYAVVAGGGRTDAGFIFYRAHAILRSDDGGQTWRKVNMPKSDGSWANLAWHALSLAVDPNDPDVLYAGGLDQNKSKDGGETWMKISDWIGMYDGGSGFPYIHADQHRVVFRNHSSDEIVFATDGGIFYTANGGSDNPDFIERNDRYNTLQFYTCAMSPLAGSSYFLAGAQDNGTLFYKGIPVNNSDMISGGDGAYCFFDTDQPDHLITSVYYNRYYVYQSLSGLNPSLKQYIDDYYSGVFINPADYDSRLNKLYANAVSFEGNYPDQILRIDNLLGAPSGTFLDMNTGTGVYFSAITVSPFSPENHTTLFAGTHSGRLYRADMADQFPLTSDIGSPSFPAASISSIAVGPDEDHLLVTFSNYGVSSVWETRDGGVSWSDVEGDLPDMPVRWAIYHPANPLSALIATETGIWVCDDLTRETASWYPAVEGMGSVRTDMIRYRQSDGLLLVATHGRGLFTSGSLSTVIPDHKSQELNLRVWPNPASERIHLSINEAGDFRLMIYTASGQLIRNDKVTVSAPAGSFSLDVSNIPPGHYYLRLCHDDKWTSSKLIIAR